MKKIRKFFPLLFLSLFSSIIFSFKIDSFPLQNWDEAWYAEITKNMALKSTGLLMPYWNGDYYFDKPPLYFWLSAPFFKFFGVGEWQARIVSVFASIGTTVMIYLVGSKLFGKKTGFVSAIVFPFLGQVIQRFSKGNLDALMIFCFLTSFYFFITSRHYVKRLILSGIFAGLGILTKGWIFALYFGFLMFLYSFFWERRIPSKKILTVFLFAFISSIWWFILGYLNFGKSFWEFYIFDPLAGNLSWKEHLFSFRLFKDFVRDIGFWVIPAAVLIFRRALPLGRHPLFLILGVFVYILPISFFGDKYGWYLLPTYPLVALFIGLSLVKLFRERERSFYLALFSIILIQNFYLDKVLNAVSDKSIVSARLGLFVGKNSPRDAQIVLDSPDFPSFIFYSDRKVLATRPKQGLKYERWVVSYADLARELDEGSGKWIVTQDPSRFSFLSPTLRVIPAVEDFKIVIKE